MTTPRYHIPFFQPLPPSDLIAGKGDLRGTFPFSAPRVHHFYMARNAIWHGVDLLGLKPGDEVLLPAYHHGVEVEVLVAKGLKPRFYRVDEGARIHPEDVERALTPATKAIYLIHYFGFPQPVEEVLALARRRGLPLIEDCALSLFSTGPRGALGSFGDIGIFCLYKTLPLPHGGSLVLNREGLQAPPESRKPGTASSVSYIANLMLDWAALRMNGAGSGVVALGKNLGRFTKRALRASTIPVDTSYLDMSVIPLGMGRTARYLLRRTRPAEVIAIRRRNFQHLASLLQGAVRPLFPELPEGVCPLSYPVYVRDKERAHEELLRENIGNVNFWSRTRPEIAKGAFPEVDAMRRQVLELPIHQGLLPRHIEYIAERGREPVRW
jgi:perosamine synthetase